VTFAEIGRIKSLPMTAATELNGRPRRASRCGMGDAEQVFWFAAQALAATFGFPPTALLVVGGCAGAIVSAGALRPNQKWGALVAVVVPLALPVAIVVCGVLLTFDTDLDAVAPSWPEWLVYGLLAAHLPTAVGLMALLNNARRFVLATSVAAFGLSCGAAFMSIMAVSGRWL
jgi:hypothetical protein